MARRRPILIASIVLATTLLAAPGLAGGGPAGPPVQVLAGSTPQTAVFPNDVFTVADPAQHSGLRVNLPVPTCTQANYSDCDAVTLLNQLDGFDLQPRIFIPLTGAVDLSTVTPTTVWVQAPDGTRAGLFQLVLDPATHVLEGTVDRQLAEDTRYTVTVSRGVHDTAGRPLARASVTAFTTETATGELDRIRAALDSGAAYGQAQIPAADRGLSFQQGGLTTVFPGPSVVKEGIVRNDQTYADPAKPLTSSTVPDLVDPGSVGYYAFGSFLSPQFVTADAFIPQVPTNQTPPAQGAARLGFTMLVPAGTPPPGGWPVAVYGPGFTRSDFDLYVTADHNAALGIATVATDPLGHGFGPLSTITVRHLPGPGAPAVSSTFLSYGRGRDLDGDGVITDSEGVQPSDHKVYANGVLVSDLPSHQELVGLRDGLIQTTADQMALIRAIERGVNVPTDIGPVPLSGTNIRYYGLSFGGIYGTMLLGTDPHVRVGLLNSGGGPILDIARLGGFRGLLAEQLGISRPNLLNGGPGLNGFTESLPAPTDPPVSAPYPGSAALRQFLADGNWLERQGSPEAFAPLIRLHPRYGPKTVEFSNGFGDHTVPNLTTGNVVRAGGLLDRMTYYRNDLTPTAGRDPHGFLADPTLSGRTMAEAQLAAFLASDGTTVIDPDGPGPVFEVPIVDPANLQCLHYPDPQTGSPAFPPPAAGPCPPVRYGS